MHLCFLKYFLEFLKLWADDYILGVYLWQYYFTWFPKWINVYQKWWFKLLVLIVVKLKYICYWNTRVESQVKIFLKYLIHVNKYNFTFSNLNYLAYFLSTEISNDRIFNCHFFYYYLRFLENNRNHTLKKCRT